MKKSIASKRARAAMIIAAGLLTLVCLGIVPRVVASDMPAGFSLNATEAEQALHNAPATALPNGNTKDGILALQNVTTGAWDSAFGAAALYSDTTGSLNDATGVGSLFHNIQGHHNVAGGVLAMYYNTSGWGNSAYGYGALYLNQSGIGNVGLGGLAGLQITATSTPQ